VNPACGVEAPSPKVAEPQTCERLQKQTGKGGMIMKKSILIIFMAAVLALMSFATVSAAEVTFKAIAFIPKNHALMSQTVVWVDMINKEMAGKVKINYVGGPEVIPGMQQAEAVKNGVIDIAFNPTAYYQNIFPEAGAFILSQYTPSEERKPGGFYDYMVKQHERINIRYIGRVMWTPFYLWPNKEVKTLADLKGMKMRTSALYDRFMKALGIVPVTIPAGDTYTGLERGTVEGFGWPNMGPRKMGWVEVVKNVIDLPFYSSNNILAIMNLDKWKKLPKDVQDQMIAVTAKFEPIMYNYFVQAGNNEWAELDKLGIKRIKFSDAENKKYIDTAYQVEWDNLAKKIPGQIAELKRITGN
jgi:TRAP-type C4-dicarboxylate transport system substrate-binding protein